jgi:hypothetical protein
MLKDRDASSAERFPLDQFPGRMSSGVEVAVKSRFRDAKRVADATYGAGLIGGQGAQLPELLWTQLPRPTALPSSSSSSRQTGHRPFLYEISLELSQSSKEVKDQLAAAGCCIQLLLQASKLHTPTDPRIKVREIPAQLAVATKFSGRWSDADLSTAVGRTSQGG